MKFKADKEFGLSGTTGPTRIKLLQSNAEIRQIIF